jgi:uncharacterized protein
MYEETIDLSHLPSEGLRLERRIHENAWKITEPDWQSRGELAFELLIKGNPQKASVEGNFDAGITASCHRCLKRLALKLDRKFHLTYLAPDPVRFSRDEVGLTGEELEVAYFEKPLLPLHELIREQVYLAVPMKFLCKADCRGLCVRCGADLNEVECSCPRQEEDPRWASLKSIVPK